MMTTSRCWFRYLLHDDDDDDVDGSWDDSDGTTAVVAAAGGGSCDCETTSSSSWALSSTTTTSAPSTSSCRAVAATRQRRVESMWHRCPTSRPAQTVDVPPLSMSRRRGHLPWRYSDTRRANADWPRCNARDRSRHSCDISRLFLLKCRKIIIIVLIELIVSELFVVRDETISNRSFLRDDDFNGREQTPHRVLVDTDANEASSNSCWYLAGSSPP